MKKLCLLLVLFASSIFIHPHNTPDAIHTVIEQCNNSQVQYIQCFFTDLQGILREIILPANKLQGALYNGLKFDGSSIPGYSNISTSDMHLALDANSYYEHDDLGFIFCTVYQDEHTPYQADPRWLLEQALERARANNYEFNVGPEIEFFLLDECGNPCDNQGYVQAATHSDLFNLEILLLNKLAEYGISIEKIHHEVAPGQYEIVLHYADALTIADHIMLAKYIITQMAYEYGLSASFLPKPFLHQNGSGMHVHFSLYNTLFQQNAFYESMLQEQLSMVAQQFIAGILNRISEYVLITNPTLNSYLRIRPGFEAPTNICWSPTNRSALIRIPQINASQPYAARAELRCPDSSSNPYLVFAFMLNAGLEGILEQEAPWPMISENIFAFTSEQKETLNIQSLPGSFEQALQNFENTKNNLFNDCFHAVYAKLKHKEFLSTNSH